MKVLVRNCKYKDVCKFSDSLLSRLNGVNYPYNLYNNTIEILYNIQWKSQHLIMINRNKNKIDTIIVSKS